MREPPNDLRGRIEAHLARETGGRVVVRAIAPLAGGACQDNFAVDLTLEAGELAGERRLALRSDARSSLPGSIDRRREFRVIEAAAAAGVRTPRARWLAEGLVRAGAAAYFLDWAAGEAIGRKVVRDAELEAARAGLAAELAEDLARIHAITPATNPELVEAKIGVPADGDAAAEALRFARAMIEALPEARPALALAMRWLEANAPSPSPLVLVHGDFRTGNLLVRPEGLSAILDWEFAHFGSPAEDLAWISVRNWRFGRVDRPVGGFASRDAFYGAYEAASGRRVDRAEVLWWEVMGNVRWAAGCLQQGERYASGRETDIELVAIPLHAGEMEFEALRLVRKAEGRAAPPAPAPPRAASATSSGAPQTSGPARSGAPDVDGPDLATRMAAIARFLERDVKPALRDPGLAFRVLVAASLAGTTAAQLATEEELAEAELDELARVLPKAESGCKDEGERAGDHRPAGRAARRALLARVRRALADAIREGRLSADDLARAHDAVTAVLRRTLAVTSPRFDTTADID